jgi:ribosomal protein S21
VEVCGLGCNCTHETYQHLVALALQVDKAMKTLSRRLVAGNMLNEWKKRAYFVRPAEQRVLDQKETDKRLAKKRFKAQMNAIAARQAQCGP